MTALTEAEVEEIRGDVEAAFLLAEIECGGVGVCRLKVDHECETIRLLREDFPTLVGEKRDDGRWYFWLPEELPEETPYVCVVAQAARPVRHDRRR